MAIKLAIGCHSYVLGEALGKLLEDEREIDVIGIFTQGIDSKEIIKMNPDVVLCDFNIFRDIPEEYAIDAQIKILLIGDITAYSVSHARITDLISRGVVGTLPAGADSRLLKKGIKAVVSGELWLNRKRLRNILHYENLSKKGEVQLTKAEREIVSLICQGYRNKEIARKRNITEQTVKCHCNRIYKKVGVSDRLQLAIHVYKLWPNWFHLRH